MDDAGDPHAEYGEDQVEDEVDVTASDAGDGAGGHCELCECMVIMENGSPLPGRRNE